jgi:hypothetical protein
MYQYYEVHQNISFPVNLGHYIDASLVRVQLIGFLCSEQYCVNRKQPEHQYK